MPKIDFTKVEKSLREGLLKMSIEQLIYIADLASVSFKTPSNDSRDYTDSTQQTAQALTKALQILQTDLTQFRKDDRYIYKKLKIDKKQVKRYFEHPKNLTPQDWEKIKEIREKLEIHKKNLRNQFAQVTDDERVMSERKKQKTKRFNVNDNWIPLQ